MGDELPSLSNDGRIATEKRGHIFLVVIDRPKKLNGFSVKMLSELGRAFSMMEDDTDIRCGVLCAEGRNFTAGLELNQVAKHLAEGPLFSASEVDPVNLHGRGGPGHLLHTRDRVDVGVGHRRRRLRLPFRANRGETRNHALSWRDHPDDRARRFGQRLAIPLDR